MADKWQTKMAFSTTNMRMLDQESLCDVTFLIGDRERPVRAHKFMLASRSPVFHAMFCGPLAESGDSILIPDIEDDIFKLVLRYVYTAECPLTPDTVMALMYAAKKYELTDLSASCIKYLESIMTADNVCTILQQALEFDEKSLRNKSIEFVGQNSSKCLRSKSFLSLSLDALKLILVSDQLLLNEADVYTASVKWAEHQCKTTGKEVTDANCRAALGNALMLIKFPLMSKETFMSLVCERDILTSEEKSSLSQHFVSEEDIPIVSPFSGVPRPGGTIITICRLPEMRRRMSWAHHDNTDAIDFVCERDCLLLAVGLFTPKRKGDVVGKLIIYEGFIKLLSQKISIQYKPHTRYADFVLCEHIKIEKYTRYTIIQTCSGSKTFSGVSTGNYAVKGGLGVRFYNSAESDNGTDVSRGQIRHLKFCV